MSENKQEANETNTRPQEGAVQLPFELIIMIFSWLLPREAFRIARVSRPFKDYVYSSEYARMALKLVVNKADLIASFLNIPSPQFQEAIALTCMQDVQAIDSELLNRPISYVHIPAALGLVKNAASLGLAGSRLIGSIPKEMGQLDSLTYLNLAYNDLKGPIPAELGNLIYLTTIDLGNNQTLSSALPPEFGRLVNLRELKLPYTSVKGPIPAEYGQLKNLTFMDLSHTKLNCKIPPELGQLKSLVHLHLNNSGLIGEIPPELSNLDALAYMYLQENRLEGSVPKGFYERKSSERPYFSWTLVMLQGNRSSELNSLQWKA